MQLVDNPTALKVFGIYIICSITGGTLCYVLKIEGGFLNEGTPLPTLLANFFWAHFQLRKFFC